VEDPSSSQHCQKYLTKMRVHRIAKKSAPKTTTRQQSVIKARLKLLTQNFFSAKSINKCVMDDELNCMSEVLNDPSHSEALIVYGFCGQSSSTAHEEANLFAFGPFSW
jgi:hypothetical protein